MAETLTDKVLDIFKQNYLTKINYENKRDRKRLLRDDMTAMMAWSPKTASLVNTWISSIPEANAYYVDEDDLRQIFDMQGKALAKESELSNDHSFSIEHPNRPRIKM